MLTTYQMDGLLSQVDIDNRYKVMKQCMNCNKWTQQDLQKRPDTPCSNCGSLKYNPKSTTSLRTFNPDKRKTTRKKEKVSGQ